MKGKTRKKIIDIFRYIMGFPKSIYINFKYFPLKIAIKLPIYVSHKVKFQNLEGEIILGKIKPGIVRIGFGSVENYDFKYTRTSLNFNGKIYFEGKAKIGYGSKISNEGTLILGNNFQISAASTIICRKKIKFGENNLIAWDSVIMDTDHHHIYNFNEEKINENREINIGNNVWIGAKVFILKGSQIPNDSVVGAGSIVSKKITEANVIISGNPAKIVRKNIKWKE